VALGNGAFDEETNEAGMTTNRSDIPVICPVDRHVLYVRSAEANYTCPRCKKLYPIKGGVVCMIETPNEFYEGHYRNHTRFIPKSEKPWHVWPLWLINSGYLWAVRKWVPAGATVIELGCAGGGCAISDIAIGLLDAICLWRAYKLSTFTNNGYGQMLSNAFPCQMLQ